MAEFFLCHWDRRRKKIISMVPRTSTSPRINIISSNSADQADQVSPSTIPGNTPFLFSLALLPNPQSSTRQSFFDLDHYIVDSFPSFSGTSALVSFFVKTLGCTLIRKSTCSFTYSLIQDSTSGCSLDTHLPPTVRAHGKVCTLRSPTF